MDQWQSFERALYGLQQKQCFASLDEYLLAKRTISESLSPPASDTLFYRYAYGPGGYVDLASGMQLRIERDFFTVQSSDPPSPTEYQGTTITYYSVSDSAESGAALKFLRTKKKPAGFTIPGSSSSDANLVTRFARLLTCVFSCRIWSYLTMRRVPPSSSGQSPTKTSTRRRRQSKATPEFRAVRHRSSGQGVNFLLVW